MTADVYARIKNAEERIAYYAKKRDTKDYGGVDTEAVVSHELWNWTTQLIILQKMKPINQEKTDATEDKPEPRSVKCQGATDKASAVTKDPFCRSHYHSPYGTAD